MYSLLLFNQQKKPPFAGQSDKRSVLLKNLFYHNKNLPGRISGATTRFLGN
jgi:hypothetical protein